MDFFLINMIIIITLLYKYYLSARNIHGIFMYPDTGTDTARLHQTSLCQQTMTHFTGWLIITNADTLRESAYYNKHCHASRISLL